MKKSFAKRITSIVMGCLMALTPISVTKDNRNINIITAEAATGSAIVNTTTLNVRSDAGTSFAAVGKLSMGSTVNVVAEKTGTDGNTWYQITYSSGAGTVNGYVLSSYLKFPSASASSDGNFEAYMQSQGFPESYKPGLRELHKAHPNWTFTSLKTGLDWDTVIREESVVGRNLTGKENISSWKSTAPGAYNWETSTWPGFDGSVWVAASEDIIKYYIDPRNFLNDKYIYQFMNQKYNAQTQTREALASMVAGTFLAGNVPGTTSAVPATVNNNDFSNNVNPSTSGGIVGPGGIPVTETRAEETKPAETKAPETTGSQSTPIPVSPVDAAGVNDGSIIVAPLSPIASVTTNKVNVVMEPGPGSGSPIGGSVADSGITVSGATSYVDVIMNAAAQSGVNPYVLASMIIQEQGTAGTGNLISGKVSGYQGYYNYFNVEAYQSGSMSAVQRGLWWASQSGSYGRPWNTREKAIIGGAKFYGENYLNKGQTTLYLKKFNVQGSNLYKHQYMTNVLAAAAEGLSLAKISSLGQAQLDFVIPVYNNMPESPCVKPTGDGCPNNKLKGIAVEGFGITPSFDKDTLSYDLIVDASVASVKVNASALNNTASIAGTGTIDLASGINAINIMVKAQNGDVRTYTLNVVRQTGGPVYNSSISGSTPSGGGIGPSGIATGPGMGAGPNGGSTNVTINGQGPVSPVDQNNGTTQTLPNPDNESVAGFGSVTDSNTQISVNKPVEKPGTIVNNSITGSDVVGAITNNSIAGTISKIVKGDTNGDGKLNIMDVLNVQRHILGLASIDSQYSGLADVNGNGKIDIMDVLLMQKDILGIAKLN